jgi:hypothetical protein
MSMPPIVKWRYRWEPEAGSPEAALYSDFLPHRDWLRRDDGHGLPIALLGGSYDPVH